MAASHPPNPISVSVNDPPAIYNQTYNINEDTTLAVTAANGLLGGSSDADGDPIVVLNSTAPANGKVTVQKNGSFVYVPNPDFNGKDSFVFWATDNQGGIVKATVTIKIGECLGFWFTASPSTLCSGAPKGVAGVMGPKRKAQSGLGILPQAVIGDSMQVVCASVRCAADLGGLTS